MTEKKALSIHVPEPPGRPGDAPDFSHVKIDPAGAVRCPDIDSPADQMQDLAYSIIRILDRDGEPRGPWYEFLKEDLSDEQLKKGLRDMMLVRALDSRMLKAQRQGKTSFYVQATGEEAITCGFAQMLEKGDMNFPTYRQQGLLVAGGYPILLMMCQIFSNEKDPVVGRQLPVCYSSKEFGFFSVSGNLGTQFVQAVGWAMASAIDGNDRIAVGWIGEGSTAENDFHSALVFASVYKPPVILNVTNNQWAISSFNGIAGAENATFAARAHGFAIPSIRVDGNDFLAVLAASRWAVKRARSNLGPTLIEWVTYRVGAHSSSDDPSAYRPKEESDSWPLGDPVERLKNHLISRDVLTEAQFAQMGPQLDDEIMQLYKEAEGYGTLRGGHRLPPAALFEDVYETMPDHLNEQLEQMLKERRS